MTKKKPEYGPFTATERIRREGQTLVLIADTLEKIKGDGMTEKQQSGTGAFS